MKRVLLAGLLMALGCRGSAPPPKVCEMPTPEPKPTSLGFCPVGYPASDAGADGDSASDAPID
jgi:hypothetical protein